MMPAPAREFTDTDWMAFTRAQPWAARSHAWGCTNDLGAPLIHEVQNGTVVCGSAACEFYEGKTTTVSRGASVSLPKCWPVCSLTRCLTI
jgi:hypothetical protein